MAAHGGCRYGCKCGCTMRRVCVCVGASDADIGDDSSRAPATMVRQRTMRTEAVLMTHRVPPTAPENLCMPALWLRASSFSRKTEKKRKFVLPTVRSSELT